LAWRRQEEFSRSTIRREESFNAVNLAGGYPLIRIVSPNELIYDHEDED